MQKQCNPTHSNTSLSAVQALYLLIWVNPNRFNPFWLPAVHTSAVGKWGMGNSGFGLPARSMSHSSARVFTVHSGMMPPLVPSQSIWKCSYCIYSVFILSQYQQMVKCHSLALSFLLLYVSDCWHNFSRICLGNFEHLTFSACHLVLSLQSHKRKWLLEGHSYIYHPECIMVRWM